MRFVVVDVETTGVVPVDHRIAWLALAVVDDGVVTRRWSVLLDAGATPTTDASTGLPRHAFADIADEFLGLVEGAVLVAHNARFDLTFLAAELGRSKRPMPRLESLCTMKLTRFLDVRAASLSLVDCCAAFGIIHRRRHRADEDVEATVQLLNKLLPLAREQGWASVEELADVLRPAGRDDGELSFSLDLSSVIADFFEGIGWDPDGEESLGDAARRSIAVRRSERDARYATMTVDHRAAHEAWDACPSGDDAETTWSPILAALEREGCDELAEAWSAWMTRCNATGQGRRRRLVAAIGMLNAILHEPAVTRERFEWHMHALITAAEPTVTGIEQAIGWYVDNVDRLAALPPCGDCYEAGYRGECDRGCRTGLPCIRANLGSRLVLLIEWHIRTPRTFERLAGMLASALKREPDPSMLARLAGIRLRRYLDSGQDDEAWRVWREVQDHTADVGMLPVLGFELPTAMEHLLRHQHYGRVIEVLAPLASIEPTFGRECRAKIRDALAESLERAGRIDEAMVVWRRAIDDRATEKVVAPYGPAKVQWKYDRLSLHLERQRDYQAALATCAAAIGRFRQPLESLLKRAERCRNRVQRGQ